MKRFLGIALLLLGASCFNYAYSQTPGTGTWNILNVKKNFDANWNGFFEAQLRSQQFIYDFYYYELKAGIGYNVSNNFSVLTAIGKYETDAPDGNFKSPVSSQEFRLWEQFTLTNDIKPFKIEHRYRIEQRWTTSGYKNRFRYRLNSILPLNKKKIENHTLYASVYDELFFTNEKPYFERNRFYGGFGYSFSSVFTLQFGLVRQYDLKVTPPSIGKNSFVTNLFVTIGEHKSKKERHPSSDD